MKQPIVDPFVPAPGQLARSKAVEAARQARPPESPLQNRRGSIDGIVPVRNDGVKSPVHRPYRGPAGSLHLEHVPRSVQASKIEGVSRPISVSRPALARRPVTSTQRPTTQQLQAAPDQLRPKPKKEGVSTLWLLFGAAFAGLAMFSVVAGQVAIAVYAVAALWRRWPSQQNFGLALVMFGGIVLASLVPAFKPIADNLAVYAFLLLCIGTLSLAREVRRDTRQTA